METEFAEDLCGIDEELPKNNDYEGSGLSNVLLNSNSSSCLRKSVTWSEMLQVGVIGLLDFDGDDEKSENEPTPPPSPSSLNHQSPSSQDIYHDCSTEEYINYQKTKKFKPLEEGFFTFKKPSTPSVNEKENLFEKLSDEIVLHILSMIPQATLAKVATVSKRFRDLCLDETLWYRLDLAFRTLQSDSLYYILSRGVRALRLASSSIVSPVFESTKKLAEQSLWKVEYLDLSDVHITEEDAELLLTRCRNLKKLSIEACPLTDRTCLGIANNPSLDTLNMAMCSGLTAQGLSSILCSCKKLESLNVSWCNLQTEAVAEICSNISPNIKFLNLAGALKSITNEDIGQLSRRCKELIELDLSDCTRISNVTVQHVVSNLPHLKTLSLSRCYKISLHAILLLKDKPSLQRLNIFGGMFSEDQMKMLKVLFSRVSLNEEMMSSIARPTVGIRRTSIWGIRCRE